MGLIAKTFQFFELLQTGTEGCMCLESN